MTSVLIIGGHGRIGASVAKDVLTHTDADVTVTGRRVSQALPNSLVDFEHGDRTPAHRCRAITLDLADNDTLGPTIAAHNLVIHCAGPFHHRDARVLKHCIHAGVDYLDVSDCVPFTQNALPLHRDAQQAGITAIINTGVFPGISNSMVRLCMEEFEQMTGQPGQMIELYYTVAGSGGAGVTVLRTTFLGLQKPFQAWIAGQWQQKMPYSDRQMVTFPPPYGRAGVYWYEVPETITLAQSFPVQTVITKFGSIPDWYNHLTWLVAHWLPKTWLQQPATIETLSHISYRMTQMSDRFSGTGIAMLVRVTKADSSHQAASKPVSDRPDAFAHPSSACNQSVQYQATLVHPDTAIAAGAGTGSLAQLLLSRELQKPGVYPVEAALPTTLFQTVMEQRQIQIIHGA